MKNKLFMALLAGTMLLAACKGSHPPYEVANTSSPADSAKTDNSDTVAITKLIKTAEMRFKVKSVTKTGEDISALILKYQGIVMHNQMSSTPERSNDVRLNDDSVMHVTTLTTSADITARIPSDKLNEFMDQVGHMGLFVNLRKMDIEDHTFDYLSNKLKLNSRKVIIDQQMKGKVVIKHAEDVMALKDDMIDQQINNQRVNEAVKYSMVNLNIYQSNTISKETVANNDPAAYELPFAKRLALAISNGWYLFKETLIAITNLWALLTIGALAWIIVRRYKIKKPSILPSHV